MTALLPLDKDSDQTLLNSVLSLHQQYLQLRLSIRDILLLGGYIGMVIMTYEFVND